MSRVENQLGELKDIMVKNIGKKCFRIYTFCVLNILTVYR